MANDERGGDELFEDLDKFFAPIRDVDWDESDEPAVTVPAEEHVAVRTESTSPMQLPDDEPEAPRASDEGDEDAWYDTGQLEEIDEILGERPADATEDVIAVEDYVEVQEPVVATPEADPTVAFDAIEAADVVVRAPSEQELEAAAEHFAGSLARDETYPTEPVDVVGREPRPNDLLSDLGADDVEDELLSDMQDTSAPRTVVVGGEGITGPSWQEPASVEVGAEIDRRGSLTGDRDVPAAFMTGLILAGVAVVSLWAGPAYFAAFAGLLVLVAQGELFGVLVKHHFRPAALIGLVAGALMMLGAYWRGESATPAMFALGVIAAFLWYMTVPVDQRVHVVRDLGLTILNMAWIPLLAGYLIATLKLPDGKALVLWVILLTFLFDTAAFLIGSVSGGGWIQRPLAPNVSPKKSWEGIIGGALATAIASVAFLSSFVGVFEGRKMAALALGLVIAGAATFGDLAESLLKRDIGVKDMGTLLPGHGGVLDRIDSLLFVAPTTFLLFRVIFG
ncbi:MAG: phosphatidate cytidylyltransferase [Actinomycetota bacterium]